MTKRLSQVQRLCIINFLGDLELIKNKRSSYNLKHLIQGLYYEISDKELAEIMDILGIEGTRQTHNVSQAHIEMMLIERAWKDEYWVRQCLSLDKTFDKVKAMNQGIWSEYYETIKPWTAYPFAVDEEL